MMRFVLLAAFASFSFGCASAPPSKPAVTPASAPATPKPAVAPVAKVAPPAPSRFGPIEMDTGATVWTLDHMAADDASPVTDDIFIRGVSSENVCAISVIDVRKLVEHDPHLADPGISIDMTVAARIHKAMSAAGSELDISDMARFGDGFAFGFQGVAGPGEQMRGIVYIGQLRVDKYGLVPSGDALVHVTIAWKHQTDALDATFGKDMLRMAASVRRAQSIVR